MSFFFLSFVIGAKYKAGQSIISYPNVIGPNNNPIETFPFLSLPFCTASSIPKVAARQSIGDVFLGNSLQDIGIRFRFLENENSKSLCNQTLTVDSAAKFAKAVTQNYWALFYLDGFPVWHPLGDSTTPKPQLYTQFIYTIGYNGAQIVDVSVACGNGATIEPNSLLTFTFSVIWQEKHTKFNNRFNKFNSLYFFKNAIHQYSVSALGLLVVLFIALIFVLSSRMLTRDSNKSIEDAVFEGFDLDITSEKGWKVLRADVFRPPRRLALWSILAGAGIHFLIVLFAYTTLSNRDTAYERDRDIVYAIISFVTTAPIAGFIAVTIGRAFSYQKWLRLAFGSVCVLPLFALTVYIITGLFGSSIGSARSFGLSPIFLLAIVEIVAVLPLALLGGFLAVKLKLFEGPKCDVALVPRYIASHPWYLKQSFLAFIVGGICFLSIVIEVYYVLIALWNYVGLYVWGYLVFGCLVLCVVAGCSTILIVYGLLQNEVHFWQWPAFLSPAATGIWVFVYSIHFLITKTRINGLYQTVYFLMYMGEFSACVGLLAGGIGLIVANAFVHKIFTDLKLD